MALEKQILTIDNVQYVLPVPPGSWEIQGSNNVGSTNVMNFGEMNNGSQPNLKTTSISSFFPIKNLGFVSSSEFKEPLKYIEAFDKAREKGTVIEYQITDTPVYMNCIITGFNYGEQDYTGDYYYTLELKEDKSVELVNKDGKVDAKGYVPENSIYGYYWEVKEGDTLLKIAKSAYGDSSKYTDIMAKNNIKNVNKIKVGMVLTL